MRAAEKPTRTLRDNNIDDYVEDHPAYAVVGASRWTTGPRGIPLAGSDFLHGGMVVISVKKARLHRGLSSDRFHTTAEPTIVEVAFSEAQWATFVSTLNSGEGVPATLMRVDGLEVPGIDPITDRREQFNAEVADTLAEVITELEEVRDATPSKKGRDKVDHAIMQLRSNLPFVTKRFDEHAESTVEKAKSEVAAYVQGALQRAGMAALAGSASPLTLATSEGDDDGD